MFNVRIRGVDRTLRNLASVSDEVHDSAKDGCNEAAKYLLEKVRAKFGVYQSTGGDPGGRGRWKKLSPDTMMKKISKYGFSGKPLIATGKTVGSLKVKEGGVGRLAASVSADSDYLVHHVYGAPGANVPMRDPMRVTAVEERDACHEIIEKCIQDAIRRSGL